MHEFALKKLSGYDIGIFKSETKKGDWKEEYEHLEDQLIGFIDRGDFARHGMSVKRTSGGALELNVYDVNEGNFKDGLVFEITIARDGVSDDWTALQYRDDRAGYFVTVIRTHPTKGDMVLERETRVNGGFRALTTFIRKYVGQFEEDVRYEFGGFSVQDDFEDYSYYASEEAKEFELH